jgi:hypothetical protein
MLGMACLLGAFAFVGSSCKKNTETNSIKVGLPTVEETNIDGDRAYIDFNDGNKMKWSKDDQIMFYNLNSDYTKSIRNPYVIFNGVGTIDGDFEGESMGAAQDLGYYAFYPAEKVENYPIGPRNSQTFEVPAEQQYNVGTMDATSLVMAVKGHSPFEHFSMSHIFGFIKLRLKGTQKVEWISVTDNEFNLSGTITIDLPAVNANTLQALINKCANYQISWESYAAELDTYLHGEGGLNYSSEPTGQTMTLYCDDPVQLNASNYTDFFITLRPGSLCKGFVVTVKYQGVEEPVVYNKFNPGAAEWAYGAYPQYPRGFAIRPGNIMGAKVN